MTRISTLLIFALAMLAMPLTLASENVRLIPSAENSAADGPTQPDPTALLESLQAKHASTGNVFVEMSDIAFLISKTGGGPCASCAANITLQACRSMVGLDPVEHPHRLVLESFRDQEALLDGRVTNHQFVKLLKFYEPQLNGAKLAIEVVSAPNSPHATDGKTWGGERPLTVQVKPGELQILSYTVTGEDGEVLGRHFVIVKRVADGQVHVVDPNVPTKTRRYVLKEQPEGSGRIFLRLPPDITARALVNELNTVFTVRIKPPKMSAPTVGSVESIKRQIDVTAKRLAEQGELKSPTVWRSETASFGLPGLDLPQELGGSNWSAEKMIEVFRHAGRHDLNLRDVVGGAHARVLAKSNSKEVREIVQRTAAGKEYIAIAITEPDHGTDFTGMQTTSTKVDGGYILDGQKRYNARLDQASHVIVFAKSVSGTPGRMTVYVLPIDAPGVEIESFGTHGLTGNSYGGIKLNQVFVPESHRIGDDDEGYDIFNEHFTYWRLMQVAAAIGTAEKALDMMTERLRTRNVYGAPIGRFTHLQQALGQSTTELKMAHSLAVDAAKLLDQDKYKEAASLVCGLKAEGIEMALRAVDAAARAFGGEGYSDRVDIGDRLRDLNGLRIADGTTDVMRSAVVMHTHGKDFWEMAFKRVEVKE